MKWYFALSEASIPGNTYLPADASYIDMVRVAVKTAKSNTSLIPHMIYDGNTNLFTKEMEDFGVKVIYHNLSFKKQVSSHSPEDKLWHRIASGAYLRVDVPIIEETDEFVLYTDCDVLFLRGLELAGLRPTFLPLHLSLAEAIIKILIQG